ncbi:MAG TPA: GNAT family N-acetyltransferase [Candidatus Nanoarchaeia archaeon]|nr:GNAT family N-acetyltransferase [Candidatus Nanoarchaeia archaeon]
MQDPTQEEWENLWSQANGGIYQSWMFNEAKRKSGQQSIVISVRENGKLVGGIMAYKKIIRSPIGRKEILEAHGTPLFINESSGKELLEQFKIEASSYFYATIAPTVLSSSEALFSQAGYTKISNHTILLDLKKLEEELWQSLEKKSIRWGIKTAQKNNLSITPLKTAHEINALYALYEHTASIGGFKPEQKEFLKELSSKGISQIFGIYNGKNIVAGALVFLDKNNKIATLSLTTASDEGLKLQAMPFLYWNILLYAKKEGFSYFDLGGYDPDSRPSEKINNINKFKERFGGAITEQPVFSTNRTYPFLRKALQKARFIRHLYKKD